MGSGMEIKDMVTALSFGRVALSMSETINSIKGIQRMVSLAMLMDLNIQVVGGMICGMDVVRLSGQMAVSTKANFKIMK